MITREQFSFVRDKYGQHASWAAWAEEGDTPKSNMGDTSIFEDDQILLCLNPNMVLVGLNFSIPIIFQSPFENFHGKGGGAYKIRYALKGTSLWGAYMTDIVKDYPEKESGKVGLYLRKNRKFREENVQRFRQELIDIGADKPTLIAFGNETHKILEQYFGNEFSVLKVTHYSHYMSKEAYREEILDFLANCQR